MVEALLAAYRASTYLVCLDALRWSAIHIDQPLAGALQTLVGDYPWAFITAWNPHSVPRSLAANTAAQQQLATALRARADLSCLYPGVGVGSTGWYEPSLFVVGLAPDTLDALCTTHGQNAYVHGCGSHPASLRLLAA